MAMRPKDPRESVPPATLTPLELEHAKRHGLTADDLQRAHREIVASGADSIPIRRLLWARTHFTPTGGLAHA